MLELGSGARLGSGAGGRVRARARARARARVRVRVRAGVGVRARDRDRGVHRVVFAVDALAELASAYRIGHHLVRLGAQGEADTSE